MSLVILLLAAILITLLGAWKIIGGSVALVFTLALAVGAIYFVFSSFNNSSLGGYLWKKKKIYNLKKQSKLEVFLVILLMNTNLK